MDHRMPDARYTQSAAPFPDQRGVHVQRPREPLIGHIRELHRRVQPFSKGIHQPLVRARTFLCRIFPHGDRFPLQEPRFHGGADIVRIRQGRDADPLTEPLRPSRFSGAVTDRASKPLYRSVTGARYPVSVAKVREIGTVVARHDRKLRGRELQHAVKQLVESLRKHASVPSVSSYFEGFRFVTFDTSANYDTLLKRYHPCGHIRRVIWYKHIDHCGQHHRNDQQRQPRDLPFSFRHRVKDWRHRGPSFDREPRCRAA